MKCLEPERLIGYACGLIDESATAEVRQHLQECPRCREVVEQHTRLGLVLNEWKTDEPTPSFDARIRQAVELDQRRHQGWGMQWFRSLALASLGFLIVAGAIWFRHSHRAGPGAAPLTARQHVDVQPAASLTRNPQAYAHNLPAIAAPAKQLPDAVVKIAPSNDDRDTQAIDDYDLAANFDLLSEIPKNQRRVDN